MSLKPGAEALDELILQPEAQSQLLEIIWNGPRVLPPAAHPLQMSLPGFGRYGATEMSSEEKFFPLFYLHLGGKKEVWLCNIYCSFKWRKNPT